jgi:superfamily II DNA or RNA helicase
VTAERATNAGSLEVPTEIRAVDVLCHAPATVRFCFASAKHARDFGLWLTSLLFGASDSVTVCASTGTLRDDLDVAEIGYRIEHGLVSTLTFSLFVDGQVVEVQVAGDPAKLEELAVTLPLTVGAVTGRVWLQCNPGALTPVRALALPVARGAFLIDAVHGFVGLAVRGNGFERATLEREQPNSSARWVRARPSDGGRPICASLSDTVWLIDETGQLEPSAWFIAASAEPFVALRNAPDEAWWTRFDELLGAPRASRSELRQQLGKVFRIPFAWDLHDLDRVAEPRDVVEPEIGVVARLVPQTDRMLLAVDFGQPAKLVGEALLHLCGHCELGHVRPGDHFSHWDTSASMTATAAHRQWDRDVRTLLDAVCSRPTPRRVSSLAECTPVEKAWLVLQSQISRMIGEIRTLHPNAERYQAAAYQRQAAQRLVAQLEDYAGAMLCDGVGLGKTYVATTVMVHYANAWRERLAAMSRSAADDPLRITVLAPNSVVSTWQREAIPALAAHGVPLATVRVLSHTKLSRIFPTSEILEATAGRLSDLEHLLLSDLVIVDEAHNFRSVAARRTVVLRDLLRLQPRKDVRRKVLLLTATPVNNSLEDLRQQASLLFSKPLWFNDNITPDGYRKRVARDVEERLARARSGKRADVAPLVIHGNADARFSLAIEFRDDLPFGVQIPRVGDYLKEQEKLLQDQQQAVRATMLTTAELKTPSKIRVASALLDRIVVQRSRELCKQIEREQGSNIELLFRPDAPAPERLVYEDVYDDTRDVLAGLLPLFEVEVADAQALSLKVYMWSDVRDGIRDAGETSTVVGLQRVLVLKRLESSPIAFLITLLRLLALHAHRLRQLLNLCVDVGHTRRAKQLGRQLEDKFDRLAPVARDRLDLLLTGEVLSSCGARELLDRWSRAHMSARPAADSDDPAPPQLDLFERDDERSEMQREQLERLWGLAAELERDFEILLGVAPGLADIVFGRFERDDWPRRFIAGGAEVDWPTSTTWGMRVITDAKLRRLVARLLRARQAEQKVIVFSQFTDTLAYIESVLRATEQFQRQEWKQVVHALALDVGAPVSERDLRQLAARTAVISGETEDRDAIINAFAPFYRLGPTRPSEAGEVWEQGWTRALAQPIDVLLASDVLAEGVNLQDASLLINYDVHWNPVRMIQRAGRVDRRLNPAVEQATRFPELEQLAAKLGEPTPRYWWHAHPDAAPATVNLLLPDELEVELQLRERIANKTLAIDFTLGLEQGTGAEAEWMAEYRYQGISALNVWRRDRAIEQVAGYQERLRRLLAERGIKPDWVSSWNGWLRELGIVDGGRILAWALLGSSRGELTEYTRQLAPKLVDGVAHWLWTTAKPLDSVLNFWLVLDGKTFPAAVRTDLGWSEDASRPLSAEDLLAAAIRIVDERIELEEQGPEIGRPFMQGASAISAGFLGPEPDRRSIQVRGFRILQLAHLAEENPC